DRIFANVNLSDKELRLYDALFLLLERDVPTPDVVVYLQASTSRLLRRIETRGRSYESNMSREYIAALNEAYNYFFFHYDAAPVLVVDSNALDLEGHPEQGQDLLERIAQHTGGTIYYRPLGAEEP
ncbi:MAG TPA: deoxynucleoside kinase, partial [Candidatus Eisenbacteria bacterium]|nr:deoxynucleoside kinase [Candidatus Eisenbacteria bacterium]